MLHIPSNINNFDLPTPKPTERQRSWSSPTQRWEECHLKSNRILSDVCKNIQCILRIFMFTTHRNTSSVTVDRLCSIAAPCSIVPYMFICFFYYLGLRISISVNVPHFRWKANIHNIIERALMRKCSLTLTFELSHVYQESTHFLIVFGIRLASDLSVPSR